MSYISHFSRETAPALRVELTLDACVYSREMRDTLTQMHRFFDEVQQRTGWEVSVVHREPNQIFHEKTKYLNPSHAPKNPRDWPDYIRDIGDQMAAGTYIVEPSGEVEARYMNSLRQAVYTIAEKEIPGILNRENIHRANDMPDALTQSLFTTQQAFRDRTSKARKSDTFKSFAEERANAGERAMAEFTRNRPAPAEGEQVVGFFVSSDRGAREQVSEAALEAGNKTPGRMHVEAHSVEGFKQSLSELVAEVKRVYPECADISFQPKSKSFVSSLLESRLMQGAMQYIR